MNQGDVRYSISFTFIRFLALVLSASPATNAAAESTQVPVIDKIPVTYPEACTGSHHQQTGLCLLSSLKPEMGSQWLIRTKDKSILGLVDEGITPNIFKPLAPGDYVLYSQDGFDRGGFELSFAITPGLVTTIRTAAYRATGEGFAIRHFNPSTRNKGADCKSRSLSTKLNDVLPGNYLVYKPDPNSATSPCPIGGVASNIQAGEAHEIRSRTHVNQKIPKSKRYRHPDKISSLTSISQFRDHINEVALIPKWLSYNGVTNPFPKKYAALILSGMGTRTYVIPLTLKKRRVNCGRSLAKGGLSAQPVLTDCLFHGNTLTAFRVRAGGSYVTFNNRHGASAIEGNNINNSIAVQGLSVAIE
ncbi:hypothetical protein ACW73L_21900 [Methylolobus aquaticus]